MSFNPFGFIGDIVGSPGGGFLSDLLLGERQHDRQVHSQERQMAFGREQMQFSAGQADKQMAFQERMRNSAYSAATKDMQRAGLNPMLAYQQGGAHAPGGASGSPAGSVSGAGEDSTKLGGSASHARYQQEQIGLMREQANLVRADIEKRALEADVLRGPAALSRAAAGGAKALEDVGEPIRRSLTDAVEKVSTELVPGIKSTASRIYDASGYPAVVKGGKAVAELVKSLPDHLKSMLFNSAGRVRGHIPPAGRGKPMGGMRGKLGSARSWDYGPDAR